MVFWMSFGEKELSHWPRETTRNSFAGGRSFIMARRKPESTTCHDQNYARRIQVTLSAWKTIAELIIKIL
jgi:hypothetical protein